MKFELNEELRRKKFKQKNKEGKAGFFEKYEDFNCQEVLKLLDKRKKENKDLEKREAERKRRLKETEDRGVIFLRDIR